MSLSFFRELRYSKGTQEGYAVFRKKKVTDPSADGPGWWDCLLSVCAWAGTVAPGHSQCRTMKGYLRFAAESILKPSPGEGKVRFLFSDSVRLPGEAGQNILACARERALAWRRSGGLRERSRASRYRPVVLSVMQGKGPCGKGSITLS